MKRKGEGGQGENSLSVFLEEQEAQILRAK